MSVPSSVGVAASVPQSQLSSSTNTKICSAADRDLYIAQKFKNYTLFIQSIADYLPAAQTWATSLRVCPLVAFKMQIESYFALAIEKHRRGDNTGRDVASSAVVRQQAAAHGLDLTLLRAEDLAKLLRYSSLFSLLVAEDSA